MKKLCLGWFLALSASYWVQPGVQAAHPQVCLFPCLNTTTAVTSSANPQVVGLYVLLAATVTATAPATPTPAPTPTPYPGPAGSVDFSDNGTLIPQCSGSINAPVLVNGTASCNYKFAVIGNHTVKAVYTPDPASPYATSQGVLTPDPPGEVITATPSSFALGSQTASPYPTAIYSTSGSPITGPVSTPANFTALPSSPTQSIIPYQPPAQPSSTTPGSGSNLLAIVVIVVVVLLIISAGAITLLLVVK